MATALSRSPLHVRGGHLHALEEAVRCSLYTSTGRYGLSAVLWRSAREGGGGELPRRYKASWGWAAEGAVCHTRAPCVIL
eukprot:scaffold10470_cov64-Phaeocystis_antarctica.AAC.3